MSSIDTIRKRLVAALVANGCSRDDAEDLVQDVLIAEHQRNQRHPGSPVVNQYRYLLRAARRRLSGSVRQTAATVSLDGLEERISPVGMLGFQDVDWAVTVEQILRRSRRRGGLLREIAIRRCVLDGEDPADVARALGCSPGRCRTWLYRFRRDFQRELTEPPHPGSPCEGGPAVASSVEAFVIDDRRLDRIAEIAGVSEELARHYLLETEVADDCDHQRWLSEATVEEVAVWVRSCLHSVVPPDDEVGC